ncbi:MAG: hypothetical protein PHO41_00430, partial [Eubacteriales bacterium]|nr:hypothetical protein [Eubacteriales bacterium]
ASVQNLHKLAQTLAVPMESLLDPAYRKEEHGSLKSVLVEQIKNLNEEECKIAYELISRIVPMIRQHNKR